MPHDHIADLSGCYHSRHSKHSPFEHNPHGYGLNKHEVEEAVKKERKLAGMR